MHISVLKDEIITGLNPKKGEIVFDGTAGGGGHIVALANEMNGEGTFIFLDEDEDALKRTADRLGQIKGKKISILGNFKNLKTLLQEKAINSVDKIILDLGWSNFQIEEGGRGFSFKKNEPLLMTYKKNPTEDDLTAKEIVNNWSEENLELIIRVYGEERHSKKIAKAITNARIKKPIETTFELAEIIKNEIWRKGKLHPATKTFQALRIAVNDEINSLKQVLVDGFDLLKSKGRMAIISFHSLEDREVKRFFKEQAKLEKGNLISKKPIKPSRKEILENKKSRSAKLRIIEKK